MKLKKNDLRCSNAIDIYYSNYFQLIFFIWTLLIFLEENDFDLYSRQKKNLFDIYL